MSHHHYMCSGDGVHRDRECNEQCAVFWRPCHPVQEGSPAQEGALADVTVGLVPTIENPFPVYSADRRLLGSAVVTLANGTFHVRFILDPHTPEAFDLTNEPDRCRVDLSATLAGGVFKGTVTLTSK